MNVFALLYVPLLFTFAAGNSDDSVALQDENISLINHDLDYILRWKPVVVHGHDILYNVTANYNGDSHRTLLTASNETDCKFNIAAGDEYYNWKFTVDAVSDGVIRATASKSFDDLTASEVPLKLSLPEVNLTVLECGNISVSLKAPRRLEPIFLKYNVRIPCLVQSCSHNYEEKEIKYELGTHITVINRLLPAAPEYCVDARLGVYYGEDVESKWKKVCSKTDCSVSISESENRVAVISTTVIVFTITVVVMVYLTRKYCWNPLHEKDKSLPISTKAVMDISYEFKGDFVSRDWKEEVPNAIEPVEEGEHLSDSDQLRQGIKESESRLIIFSQSSELEMDIENSNASEDNQDEAFLPNTTASSSEGLTSEMETSLNYVPEVTTSLLKSGDVNFEVKSPTEYVPEIPMSICEDNLQFDKGPWNVSTLPIYQQNLSYNIREDQVSLKSDLAKIYLQNGTGSDYFSFCADDVSIGYIKSDQLPEYTCDSKGSSGFSEFSEYMKRPDMKSTSHELPLPSKDASV